MYLTMMIFFGLSIRPLMLRYDVIRLNACFQLMLNNFIMISRCREYLRTFFFFVVLKIVAADMPMERELMIASANFRSSHAHSGLSFEMLNY